MSTNVRNGVNVDNLMTAIESVKKDPANGRLTFSVRSQWKGGLKAQHTTQSYRVGPESISHETNHKLMTDEPREILGGDTGISPAETLISSLAACLAVGYATNAAAQEIELEELRFEITANGSLEGFMNLGDARPGLSDLSIKTLVKANASKEQIQQLHDYVNEHSPIWDTISNPVRVTSSLA